MIPLVLIHLIKIACVIGVMMSIVAYTVLAERKICAWMQDRIGPNRVGPLGLLQPMADGLKFVFKEDVLPHHVNKLYFTLAPMIAMVPALITIAVVPWGSQLVIPGLSPQPIQGVIADLNVGILFVFAIASLGVYGIVLAGWASNSKYPFLGGIRSSAQRFTPKSGRWLVDRCLSSRLRKQSCPAWRRGCGWHGKGSAALPSLPTRKNLLKCKPAWPKFLPLKPPSGSPTRRFKLWAATATCGITKWSRITATRGC